MRILVATEQWFPDYVGGTARAARETAIAASACGHEVTVWAPRRRGLPGTAHDCELVVERAIRRSVLPKTWTDPLVTGLRAVLRRAAGRYDVALAHHPTIAAALGIAAPNLPLVYAFHASPLREARYARAREASFPRRLRSLAVEPVLKTCERQAAQSARRIIALSEFSRQLVVADHPSEATKVRVVRGGVDTRRFAPPEDLAALRRALGLGPDEFVVLTVRRLVARMGIDVLIRAVKVAHDLGVPARLEVVGDGPLRGDLELQAADAGIADRVRFHGLLPDRAVIEMYQVADCFVLPTQAYEGFGLATIEALATGTPAIGTDAGATPEILRKFDSAAIVEANNHEVLAAAIERAFLRSGPDARIRARRLAEQEFAWDVVIGDWIDVLDDARRVAQSARHSGRHL